MPTHEETGGVLAPTVIEPKPGIEEAGGNAEPLKLALLAFVASCFADGSLEGDADRGELEPWSDAKTSSNAVTSRDFRRCIFEAVVGGLGMDMSCWASKLDGVLTTSSWCSCSCCCLCMNAGLGLMVGVAPVSYTMRTCTVLLSSEGVVVGEGGSSPMEEADDWEKRVDLVVDVEIDELDDGVEWVRRMGRVAGKGDGEGEGAESSPIARPAAINLLTPCTPSRIPSNTAPDPCPCAVGEVLSEGTLSNPRLTIRSHLRFTKV